MNELFDKLANPKVLDVGLKRVFLVDKEKTSKLYDDILADAYTIPMGVLLITKNADEISAILGMNSVYSKSVPFGGISGSEIDNLVSKDDLSMMPDAGKVPVFSDQGLLSTNMPLFPENAVPLQYLEIVVPRTPTTGTYTLKCTNGVTSWVSE